MRWRLLGVGWRVADSIRTLAEQLNEIWPTSGPTDGTVGDLSHQARRSDHNPDEDGVVLAIDVDEVIEDRGQALVDALVASKDDRISYIIHEGRIWRSYNKPGIPAWTPAVYTGLNAHLNHVHISMARDRARYDNDRPWDLSGLEGEDMKETWAIIQKALIEAGHDLGDFEPFGPGYPRGADGDPGALTQAALVKAFLPTGLHDHTQYSVRGHIHPFNGSTGTER